MPTTTITRVYNFNSAHWLPGVPSEHKCHSIHGHTYQVEVEVGGVVDKASGFLMDFAKLDEIVYPLIFGPIDPKEPITIRNKLDHALLNDVPGLGNPTAENIARWFGEKLYRIDESSRINGPYIFSVTVWEEIGVCKATWWRS